MLSSWNSTERDTVRQSPINYVNSFINECTCNIYYLKTTVVLLLPFDPIK